jgi:hypothetical protein
VNFENHTRGGLRRSFGPVVFGTVAGVLIELPAIFAAVGSAGAGHGDYVEARVLFPVPMLLTQYQGGTIGMLSISVALLQFPFYGGLLCWTLVRKAYAPLVAVGLLHLVTAFICFAGVLPSFS